MTAPTTESRRAWWRHIQARRRSRAARGLPTTDFVDATPSRRHVNQLRGRGMGMGRIVEVSGVAKTTLQNLIYGDGERPPTERIHVDTARRILATPFDPDDNGMICALGARRRLQAWAAVGWTHGAIAARVGMDKRALQRLMHGDDRRLVRAGTDRRIRVLFRESWDRLPPEDTPTQRASVVRARRRARELGWAPFLAWDDIDDPRGVPDLALADLAVAGVGGFDPAAVLMLAAGQLEWSDAGMADRVAAVAALTSAGMSAAQIAERVGIAKRSVVRLRARVECERVSA